MVDAFIDGGGTYFDTAFVYHEGTSETALRQALVERYPREAYTVATKCLAWAAPDEATAKSNLATSLERMGLDYVDFYLLHNVGGERTAKFDAYGMWDFALRKKEEGLIKDVGFSMHDGPDALEALLTAHPQMDFVQLQVNYLDWDDPVVQARRCMEIAEAHGVPVVVMEPARGGRLVELPEHVAAMLRAGEPGVPASPRGPTASADQPHGVLTVLSGMSTIGQVRQNVADFRGDRAVLGGRAPGARRAVDDAARYGVRPVHELPLLCEGLSAGRGDPRDHGPAQPGAHDGNRRRSSRACTPGRTRPALPRSASPAAPARPCAPRASTSSTSWR